MVAWLAGEGLREEGALGGGECPLGRGGGPAGWPCPHHFSGLVDPGG